MDLRNQIATRQFADGQLPSLSSEQSNAESDEHAEARFQSLVQNISDIITILAADGSIKYESPSVERVLGFKPEELVGRNAFEFIHPDDIPALKTVFLRAAATPGLTTSPEFRFRHANGSWVYLEGIGNNLLDDPDIRGLVVTSRDVTARRIMEEQLRQAQKMEAIGQLAGGIAHDFNNMLMIIRGYCELMLSEIAPRNPLRNSAEKILKTTERATGLTQRLLAFSRKQACVPRLVALDSLARESTAILQRLLKSEIELSVISPARTWQVLADPGHLDQVIMNLTVNAQDAMPNGGRLTIETANVVVDAAMSDAEVTIPHGDYVMLAISDTGVGMDAATQTHIFEPFFTTKETGTGLGLAIVYGVVKQNRGYILVSSEPGKGTAFKIYLPAVRGAAGPASATDEPLDSQRADETILLVDDEAGMREIVKQFLERSGYTVLTACDGQEALQIAERHPGPIDVLLTDVIMPRMRGPELANSLARFRQDIKIVYMSGYTENASLLEGDLARGREYLRKPFQLDALANTLHRLLAHAPGGNATRELSPA